MHCLTETVRLAQPSVQMQLYCQEGAAYQCSFLHVLYGAKMCEYEHFYASIIAFMSWERVVALAITERLKLGNFCVLDELLSRLSENSCLKMAAL